MRDFPPNYSDIRKILVLESAKSVPGTWHYVAPENFRKIRSDGRLDLVGKGWVGLEWVGMGWNGLG